MILGNPGMIRSCFECGLLAHPPVLNRFLASPHPARDQIENVPMNGSRYHWIDYLKSLGIFLVVAGHTALPDTQHRWIYAFHMPLFFMISGFLVSPGGFAVSTREFFVRKIWKLLKWYGFFGLLGAVVYCYMFKQQQPVVEAFCGRLESLIYSSASRDAPSDLYPLVLWYFPATIVAMLLVHGACKLPVGWMKVVGIGGVFMLGCFLRGVALPWELESGCMAAGFVGVGHAARYLQWDGMARRVVFPLAMAALLGGSMMAVLNGDALDVRMASIGNPWLTLPAAMMLVASLTIIFMMLPTSRLAVVISSATLYIFPTHPMVFPFVDRLAMKCPILQHAVVEAAPWYAWGKAGLVVAAITVLVVIGQAGGLQINHWRRRRQHDLSSETP